MTTNHFMTQGKLFVILLLCFLYAAFVKKEIAPLWRTIATGVLAGMLLLTRTEYLLALTVIILLLPRIAAAQWKWRHGVVALLLSLLMLMPHLYSVYEKHGTPFDGINKVTRFYVRNERVRADASDRRPDAETVTPLAYFFKMHTPGQFLRCWAAGFVKIYATMSLQFAYGKGNRDLIRYTLVKAAAHPTPNRIAAASRKLFSILKKDFLSYAAALLLLALFLAGIVLVALHRCRLVLLLMLVLQMHTSFLAAFGLDPRLTVPAYPLFTFCCGFALYRGYRRLATAIAPARDAASDNRCTG